MLVNSCGLQSHVFARLSNHHAYCINKINNSEKAVKDFYFMTYSVLPQSYRVIVNLLTSSNTYEFAGCMNVVLFCLTLSNATTMFFFLSKYVI